MTRRHLPAIIVLLAACVTGIAQVSDPAAAPAAPAATPLHLTIELTDGSRILGQPVDLPALPLKVDFARVEIPLHLIAQGAFTAKRAAFQVKFKNNDTLTGVADLQRIKIKTSYGEAAIPLARITKITVDHAGPPKS